MKSNLILIFLLISISFVNADLFLHEPDAENYSISNVGMTTSPRLNDYLALDFTLLDSNSTNADNIHVHIKTFDQDGRIIHDYSAQLTSRADSTISLQNLNPEAIQRSTGYEFFRTLPNQPNTIENRFVSDDSGSVEVLLFLNPCNVGQTQNCYFQTAIYSVNITQEGLNVDENFTIQGEKIQSFTLVQFLSTISNNTDSIIVIIAGLGIAVILLAVLVFFFLRRAGLLK